MRQGTKVIFNQDYIDEVIRHRDIAQHKFNVENMPQQKENARKELEKWEQKLEFAENFQDTIEEIKHMDIPKLTAIKTMGGYEYPASCFQVI